MPNDTGLQVGHSRASGLVDVLDRVLDKGLVVAGDIKISIAEVELLTIRIRLLVCSIDKAEQIGLDWWKHDRHLSMGGKELIAENEELREQIKQLERRLEASPGTAARAPRLRAKRLDRK
jgi:Gas vesicle protein